MLGGVYDMAMAVLQRHHDVSMLFLIPTFIDVTRYLCGYYTAMPVLANCGKRDFLNMF